MGALFERTPLLLLHAPCVLRLNRACVYMQGYARGQCLLWVPKRFAARAELKAGNEGGVPNTQAAPKHSEISPYSRLDERLEYMRQDPQRVINL